MQIIILPPIVDKQHISEPEARKLVFDKTWKRFYRSRSAMLFVVPERNISLMMQRKSLLHIDLSSRDSAFITLLNDEMF